MALKNLFLWKSYLENDENSSLIPILSVDSPPPLFSKGIHTWFFSYTPKPWIPFTICHYVTQLSLLFFSMGCGGRFGKKIRQTAR
jgi:hypothetical protein